jgi:hypothetical protein
LTREAGSGTKMGHGSQRLLKVNDQTLIVDRHEVHGKPLETYLPDCVKPFTFLWSFVPTRVTLHMLDRCTAAYVAQHGG